MNKAEVTTENLQLQIEADNPGETVCGIDEAGRGPLCGPVFAAAVILPTGVIINGLRDSKKLTAAKRDELFEIIKEKAVSWSVASASPAEIDELNILEATYLAMQRAFDGLSVKPTLALIDGNRSRLTGARTICVVKGDDKCPSISAASVLAKVSRDREMEHLAKEYPMYNLEKHKGYPTKEHYQLIAKYGVCEIYRKSFLKTLDKHICR